MDTQNAELNRSQDIDARNSQSLMRVGLMAALALLFASSTSATLMPAIFSSMALVSAAIIGAFAVLLQEKVQAPHFTRWDEAAAMLGLSLLSGMFADPVAIQEAIEQAGAAAGASAAAG